MRTFRHLLATAIAVAAPVAWPGLGLLASDPAYTRLSRELVTAHIPFANPCRPGSVKALVVAPTWTQRETVELAQRLSLDYAPLMTAGYDNFGPYEGEHEKQYAGIDPDEFRAGVDALLRRDARYEAIVIGKMRWTVLPESVQDRLLDRVRRGTGLLYVGSWDQGAGAAAGDALEADAAASAALLRGLPPLAALPRFSTGLDSPVVRAGRLGRGRIVSIDYGENTETVTKNEWARMLESLTPFRSDDPLYYDYWHSLLARATLWTAGKEARFTIAGLPTAVLTIDQQALAQQGLALRLEGARPPGANWFLHWVVRDRRNRIEHVLQAPLEGATASLALPHLKGGDKMLDVWVRDEHARVVDWASVALTVRAPVEVVEIALASDVLQKGEPLAGKLTLTRPLDQGLSVRLEAVDTHGRRVAQAAVKPGADGTLPFSLSVPHPLVCGHTLVVRVTDGRQILDEETHAFYVNVTDFSKLVRDFTFHMWDAPQPGSRSARTWLQEFGRLGIDTVYLAGALFEPSETSFKIARLLGDANLKAAPYATRRLLASMRYAHTTPEEGPDGPMIPAARNPLGKSLDELRNDGAVRKLQELARDYGPFGPAYYSLGDENALCTPPYRDVCFSEQVRKSFQAYLQVLYPDLAALNREWGANYASWDEVKAVTLKNAAPRNRYEQWIDHRMHMDRLFAEHHVVCTQAIREADPAAKVGLEGIVYPASSYTGFNLYELLPHMDFFSPYNHLPEIHAWSFQPDESLRGTWFGSYQGATEAQARYMPWHMLFEGANSISWWTSHLGGSGGIGGLGGFSPDLGAQPLLRHASEEIRAIKSGVGKLLIAGERQTHPIAVYFSNSCLHASTVRPEETTWEHSLMDFHYVLRDGGCEYEFLAPPHLLAGRLAKYKALILPYSQAVSAEEVALIEAFVKAGGALFADFAPAIMDEHGRKLEKSALLPVFGEFKRLNVRPYGKGKAICLHDYVRGYHTRRKKGLSRGVCDGMIRLLASAAGVRPFAAARDEAGNTRQDVEISQFRNGDARFLTLLRLFSGKSSGQAAGPEGEIAAGAGGPASDRVKVTLPAAHHVYDVRSNAYLGRQDAIDAAFAPGQPRIYALLPAEVQGVRLSHERTRYAPGGLVKISGALLPESLKSCGTVLRLTVRRGAEPLDHYAANVPVKGGFTHAIPLALNETPGQYAVTVRDIVSGKTAEARFTVGVE